MFNLCCIFCSFFKTFCTFEFAFHFIFMVFFSWLNRIFKNELWMKAPRELHGVTQSEVTWDDLMWFMSRIRRALDSDFEKPGDTFLWPKMYDSWIFIHGPYDLLVFMVTFLLMTLKVWRLSDLDLWTPGNPDENGIHDWWRLLKMTDWRRMLSMSHTESSFWL